MKNNKYGWIETGKQDDMSDITHSVKQISNMRGRKKCEEI